MRISRFCEARGLYESDNSIESKIFCFGDDGPSGDSSSTAASEDIGTKDVDKGPSKSAPSGGGDNQQDRQAYSDRFGGVSTRNFNVDRNQGFVDTDQGRVYGSSDVLGKGIAEGDITPSESQQAALDTAGDIATDMGIDPGNIAVGGDLFFGEDDLMANQDLSFGGGAAGPTLSGSFTPTEVTQTVKGPALGTTDYEFDALGPRAETPDSVIGLEGPAVSTPRSAEEMALTGSPTFSLDDIDVFNLDDLAPVDLDEVPAGALPGSGVSPSQQVTRQATDPSMVGLEGPAVSTPRTAEEMALTGSQTFDARPAVQGPMDNVFQEQPEDYSIYGLQDYLMSDLYVSPEQREIADAVGQRGPLGREAFGDLVRADADLGYAMGRGPNVQSLRDAQRKDSVARSVMNLQQAPVKDPLQEATLTEAERMSQQAADAAQPMSAAQGPRSQTDAEMTGIPVGATAERAVIEGRDPRAPDYTLAEAQANFEAARAEAYRDKQFGFDTGLPESIDIYGVNVPTGIGIAERVADALFDSEATLANAIAEQGIKSLDGASAEGSANYNPQGLEVVTSGGPLKEGGRTVAYDARGNVVYDSRGIGSQFGDLLTGNRPPENIQALYDRQRTIEEQQREMQGGDGGMTPMPFIGEEVVQEPVQEEYEGIASTDTYRYQPRGPISYDYTGLPSLAPTVLRPSYRPRGPYEALFPMGRRV